MDNHDLVNRWKSKRVFNAESDRFKKKRFILPTPLEMNMYGLSFDKLYSVVTADCYNRYYKMCGENLMYSLFFNDSTFSSYTFYHDKHLLPSDLYQGYIDSVSELGIGYDSSKTFHFTMPEVIKFYQNKFSSLYGNQIKLKKGPVFLDSLGLHMFNFYEIKEENGHYYVRKTNQEVFLGEETYLALDIEPYFDEIKKIIKNANISLSLKNSLYQMLGEYNYIEMDLSNYKDNVKIKISLDNPELIAGISFICLNPSLMDISSYVSQEEESTVNRYLENGYQEGVFTGNTVKNPLTGEDIYIFVSYDFEEAIHIAIPSINDKDRQYTDLFGLSVNEILEDDKMINSDFLNDLTRAEARLKIMNSFVSEEMGEIKTSFKVKEIILSRTEEYGIIVPLMEKENELGYEVVPSSFFPIYYNNRGRITITDEDKMSHEGSLIGLTFNNDFLYGLFRNASACLENELMGLKDINFNGKNMYFINTSNLFLGYMIPKIFELVTNSIIDDENIFVDNVSLKDEDISEINSLRINYINDLLKTCSPDSIRMYSLTSNPETDFDKIKIHIAKYEMFIGIVRDKVHEEFISENFTLEQELYSLTQNINYMLQEHDMKGYVEEIMKFFYKHLLNEKMTENQALTYLKLLSLVSPFVTQELFEEVFEQSYFLAYEEWPYLN